MQKREAKSPAAADCKTGSARREGSERTSGCRGGRPAWIQTHFVKAADLRAREDGEKKKRKGKIKKERKKDLGQQNSEKTAKE